MHGSRDLDLKEGSKGMKKRQMDNRQKAGIGWPELWDRETAAPWKRGGVDSIEVNRERGDCTLLNKEAELVVYSLNEEAGSASLGRSSLWVGAVFRL